MRIWVASNAIFHTYPRSSAISDLLTFLQQTLLNQGFSKKSFQSFAFFASMWRLFQDIHNEEARYWQNIFAHWRTRISTETILSHDIFTKCLWRSNVSQSSFYSKKWKFLMNKTITLKFQNASIHICGTFHGFRLLGKYWRWF